VRYMLAMIVLALAAGPTFADVGPLPFQKHVRPVHRIETHESHPDYVFVLSRSGLQYDETARRWDNYQEVEYIELTPDRPLMIRLAAKLSRDADYASRPDRHGERIRKDADLYCVPRSLAQAHASAKDVIKASEEGKAPGACWERFYWREAVPSWADDETTITYRVRRTASGDGLEVVCTSRNPRWQWNAAAIGLAAAIILFGLWLVRRALRRGPMATAK
jgi:hypothetical protein